MIIAIWFLCGIITATVVAWIDGVFKDKEISLGCAALLFVIVLAGFVGMAAAVVLGVFELIIKYIPNNSERIIISWKKPNEKL